MSSLITVTPPDDAALALDDAVLGEHADGLADRRLADLELLGEARHRRELLADSVHARADAERDLVDDVLVGARVDDGAERPRVRAFAVHAVRAQPSADPSASATAATPRSRSSSETTSAG